MAGATSEASIPTCSSVDHEDPIDDVFSDSTSISLLRFHTLASPLLVGGMLMPQTRRAVYRVFGAANRSTLLYGFLV